MIKAVVIMPAYATDAADSKAAAAIKAEIRRSFNLHYSSKLQWRDVVVLDLEDDPVPYNELPVLTLGDYAYIRAKYNGYQNITKMPSPTSKKFAGSCAFSRFDNAVGENLHWGVKDGDL